MDEIQAIAVARPDGQPPFYINQAGEAGAAFSFQQDTAVGEWIVNHNLGYRPAVEVLDALYNVITPGVLIQHSSVNQLRILVNPAIAGSVRCF